MSQDYKYDLAMLIDDSELDNLVSRVTIESAQFARKTYIHSSAKSALEFLVNVGKVPAVHLSVFPQIIFVDLNMPEMDGFQFLDYYKNFVAIYALQTKIVVLTSSGFPEDQGKVRSIDPDIIYLHKPITVEKLKEL